MGYLFWMQYLFGHGTFLGLAPFLGATPFWVRAFLGCDIVSGAIPFCFRCNAVLFQVSSLWVLQTFGDLGWVLLYVHAFAV